MTSGIDLASILLERDKKVISGEDWHDNRDALVPTGFPELDKALGGGLPNGKMTVIGAEPSYGKTTLAMQILEQMCSITGRPGLVLSMEMSAADLANKSIVRDVYKHNMDNPDACFCVNDLDNPDFTFSQMQAEAHHDAVGRIADNLANISVIDDTVDINIIGALEQTIKDTISQYHKSPIVVIDYLQLIKLNPSLEDKRRDVDNVISECKRICHQYDVLMILISAVSRKSYGRRLTMDSFKESGGVEFSADVLLGLEYVHAEEAKLDLINRCMEIIVLKNRKSRRNVTSGIYYNAEHDFFSESKHRQDDDMLIF